MKTPDEIKEALKICDGKEACEDCPYGDVRLCGMAYRADALDYILRLEASKPLALTVRTILLAYQGHVTLRLWGAEEITGEAHILLENLSEETLDAKFDGMCIRTAPISRIETLCLYTNKEAGHDQTV